MRTEAQKAYEDAMIRKGMYVPGVDQPFVEPV